MVTAFLALKMLLAGSAMAVPLSAVPAPQTASFDWWLARQKELPGLDSIAADSYLGAFSRAYGRHRHRFYVADTLNAAIWAQGDGYFILHGGLISRVSDPLVFNFLLALNLAHDDLAHGVPDIRGSAITRADLDLWWPGDFALLVGHDPVAARRFSYSYQKEGAALVKVTEFFADMGWDFNQAADRTVAALHELTRLPDQSSLGVLHRNLAFALKLPRPPARPSGEPLHGRRAAQKGYLTAERFQALRADLARSTLQRFSWMAELAPLRPIVRRPGANVETDVAAVTRLSRSLRLGTAAAAWATTQVYLNHRDWAGAVLAADRFLGRIPGLEPVQLQRGVALLFSEAPGRCDGKLGERFVLFDYRRALLQIACHWIDGRLTRAQELAFAYGAEHPQEIAGYFWRGLIAQRLRLPSDEILEEGEAKWGARPATRALRLLQAGYGGRFAEVDRLSVETPGDEERYDDEERAMLHFARGWALRQKGDFTAGGYLRRAADLWPAARRPGRLLPQAPLFH